jgi:hypothetical protein
MIVSSLFHFLLNIKRFKYLVSPSDSSNSGVRYIIGTHSHTLFIVQDAHIRWAAHIDSIPVQIDVCTIQ